MSDQTFAMLTEALRPLVQKAGLPPLASVEPAEDRLTLIQGTAVFVDGQRLLVQVPRAGLPLRAAEHVAAAHAELTRSDGPRPEIFHRLWSDQVQDHLLLRSLPRGERASVLESRDERPLSELLAPLVDWLRSRNTTLRPSGRSDGRFLEAASQREVMERTLVGTDRALRMAGFDSGSASREIVGQLTRLLDRVPEPEGCALTHGGLGLPVLRMEDDALVEIEGWTHAMVLDPLYDLGTLMHFGREPLEVVQELWPELELDADRLALGFFGKALVDLGSLAALAAQSPQPQRAELEMFARQVLERTLDQAPLSWTRSRTVPTPDPFWARLADVARSFPPPDARDLAHCAAAVAATELTDLPERERMALAHRYLDGLRPRWLAPSGDLEVQITDPVLDCVGAAVTHAFGGRPPKGFQGGLAIWDANLRRLEQDDGWDALRWRCLQSWAETTHDGRVFTQNWDMFSWRIEGPLEPGEALERALASDDPLDLPRVLGALQLENGPPVGEVLAVLFPS